MADPILVKPSDLPAAAQVFADSDLVVESADGTVSRATPLQIADAGVPVATQAEALAGSNNTKRMTALRVRQVLDDVTAPSVARAQAWAESASNPDPTNPDSRSAKGWADIAKEESEKAQIIGSRTVASAAEFLALSRPQRGMRYSSQDGCVWDTLTSGTGDFSVGGVQVRVVPDASGEASILAFGAVAGDQAAASKNVTAIRSAFLASASRGFVAVIPDAPDPFYINDNIHITSMNNGMRVKGGGWIKYADVLNAGNVISSWMLYFHETVTPLRNIDISGWRADGNKANVTISGAAPATSFGVWVTPQCLLSETVVMRNPEFRNFVTSGMQFLNGPFYVLNPVSIDNAAHGIGLQEVSPYKFSDFVVIVNPVTHRNGGYGIDYSGGKSITVNSVSMYNGYGAAKASIGLEEMIVRGAYWSKTTGVAGEAGTGQGFLTTGTAADFLNSTIDVDGIVVEDNASIGFNISAFGGKLRIGSIRAARNNPAAISAEGAEISLNAPVVVAEYLESNESTANGIGIGPLCVGYDIGSLVSRRAQKAGFRRGADGVVSSGNIRSSVLEGNNLSSTAGSEGCAIKVARGSLQLNGAKFIDTSSSPTQTGGVYASGGAKVHISGCSFGAGIIDGQQVYTATAGTRVTFGENDGVVTRSRGQFTANGGGANITYTLPSPMTTLGGATYAGYAVAASADARGNFLVGMGTTLVQAIYPAATPSGTGNLTFRYDIEMVLQR